MKPKAPIRITSNTNSTTMVKDIAAKLIDACGSDLSESQVASLYALVEDLFRGVSVFSLGATKIRRYPGFVRIKLGRNHRLIIRLTSAGLLLHKLVSRQSFDREIRRI